MPINGLTGYITKKYTKEHNPIFIEDRCVNSGQSRVKCSICKTVCTKNAFKEEQLEVIPELCNDCGICVAQCPVNAFDPSTFFLQKMQDIIRIAKEKPPIFICEKADVLGDVKFECLGSIPWEIIAIVITRQAFSYALGDCDSCDNKIGGLCFKKTLEKLKSFSGDEFVEKRLIPISDNSPKHDLTRREAMEKLMLIGRKTAVIGLPAFLKAEYNQESLRTQLLNAILTLPKEDKISVRWVAPLFNESCIACGICVKVCPTNALEINNVDENTHNLIHHSWRCGGCGICLEVCPYKGIEYLARIETDSPQIPFQTTIKTSKCKKCQEVCDINSDLCFACKIKESWNK